MITGIIFLLCIYIAQCTSYQGECDCGQLHAYNFDTNECIEIPDQNNKDFIKNCQIYSPFGSQQENNIKWKCIQCNPSYFFNGTECIETKFNNCIGFRKQQVYGEFKIVCLLCEDQYYLSQSNGLCQKQINNIQKCTKYSPYGPYCVECEEGYYILGSKCFQAKIKINNCQVYSSIGCSKCYEGFQVIDGQCYQPSDLYDNCIQLYEDQCDICEPNYFISSCKMYCVKYPQTREEGKIDNCIKYQNAEKYGARYLSDDYPICVQCNEGYALRNENKQCVKGLQSDSIKNCKNYGFRGECIQCDEDTLTVKNTPYYSQGDSSIQECRKCPIIPKQENKLNSTENYSIK